MRQVLPRRSNSRMDTLNASILTTRTQSLPLRTIMAPDTTSADIILNKTALLLAKNQRLVSSWLPPPSPSSEPPKSEAEIEKEEQKIFGTPLPELYVYTARLSI